MLRLERYSLTDTERAALDILLAERENSLSLEELYALIDEHWHQCRCSASHYDEQRYSRFYRHPIWLLNGILIEQHAESLAHRSGIAEAIRSLQSEHVLDFGGGFGTLARLHV